MVEVRAACRKIVFLRAGTQIQSISVFKKTKITHWLYIYILPSKGNAFELYRLYPCVSEISEHAFM